MRDMERKRRMDRERMRRRRAAVRARRSRDTMAWYHRQLVNPDPLPPGLSVEQHQAWCRFVLDLPKVKDTI